MLDLFELFSKSSIKIKFVVENTSCNPVYKINNIGVTSDSLLEIHDILITIGTEGSSPISKAYT